MTAAICKGGGAWLLGRLRAAAGLGFPPGPTPLPTPPPTPTHTQMANTLKTSLVVFSRKGNMPALLSHYRPDYPIYCFTGERVGYITSLWHGFANLGVCAG